MDSSDINMQIFKDLADNLAQVEFQTATSDFLNQHADKFENTDENKLEYTDIHR